MKYWIIVNGQQLGPIEETELRNYNVTPATPVWAEGMADWTELGRVESLQWLFPQQPQPERPRSASEAFAQMRYGQQPFGRPCQPDPRFAPGQQPVNDPGEEPSSNLVWAILTTIFCCLPFGVVSIVYAAQVSSAWHAGDYDRARRNSRNAATWAIVSAAVGLVQLGITVIIYTFGFLGAVI